MLQPTETSYFSPPAAGLDPRLFRAGKLDGSVRSAILQLLQNHLNRHYIGAEGWHEAWLAGSGVSFQWAANREPGDLDCLVGINFARFRESNNSLRGLSDQDIADLMNEKLRDELHPETENFLGTFELTFFVIVSPSILNIKPYAAYSLTNDEWVVTPVPESAVANPTWDKAVEADRSRTLTLLTNYIAAKNKFESANNEALKANARSELRVAASQGINLYNEIHGNRSAAFAPSGQGYSDFNNYRWQANKKSGVIHALRGIRSEMEAQDTAELQKRYGVSEFPDTRTLIRRAATYNQ